MYLDLLTLICKKFASRYFFSLSRIISVLPVASTTVLPSTNKFVSSANRINVAASRQFEEHVDDWHVH